MPALHDVADLDFCHAEGFPQSGLRHPAESKQPADLSNRFRDELGAGHALATRGGCDAAALFGHVAQIVGLGPQKEMFRIHAGGIVTSMADAQALWYRSANKTPRNTMSAGISTTLRSCPDLNYSIAMRILGSSPNPTSAFALDDLLPKGLEALGSGEPRACTHERHVRFPNRRGSRRKEYPWTRF